MSRVVLILAERRLGILARLFVIAVAVMIARLVQLQFVEAAHYEDLVAGARLIPERVAPRRGSILDREGRFLAERVERYELNVFPIAFRERNRIDALQDLILAFRPDLLPRDFAAPEVGLAREVDAREERFRLIYERRDELVRALLALPTDAIQIDSRFLKERLDLLRHPRGELVLPPSKLQVRIESALVGLADNEICGSLRALRLRLASTENLGEALATTPERMIVGIEGEFLALNQLAHDVLPEDPRAFWSKLFTQERKNIAFMERSVDRDLDDQILKVELGSHDLAKDMSRDERSALARELRVETHSRQALAAVLIPYVEAGRRDELPAEESERFVLIDDVVDGRELVFIKDVNQLRAFSDFEIGHLAAVLEVWDDDPKRLGRAFAASIRAADDFGKRKADYLSPEKEWLRILQHRDGRPMELFDGCSFEVANRVWESFGLRELGLSVRASEGRRYWEDELGVASLLLGRCNRAGEPLGGLERLLYQGCAALESMWRPALAGHEEFEEGAGTEEEPRTKIKPGPLQGRPGKLLRRRELDGSFTTLAGSVAPRNGLDVRLSLDRGLQKAAEEITAEMCASLEASGGAMAVIDLETGDILVLASAPRVRGVDYVDRLLEEEALRREQGALAAARRDGAIDKATWHDANMELRDRLEELALYDRASSGGDAGQSPPGSVLKPIAAIGMLQDGVFGRSEEIVDRHKGVVDFRRAIVVSSNAFFWEGAGRWGADKLVDWYGRFGLGRPIPLLVSEGEARARLALMKGDAAKNIVIGQGSMSLSAVEVAAMMATLARAGEVVEPRIVVAIGDEVLAPRRGERVPVDRGLLVEVTEAMARVAEKAVGSARAERLGLAGKTGTAELRGRHDGLYNAWFAGFAPRERPRLAFAVVAERTHAMGKQTAPFAAELIELITGADR